MCDCFVWHITTRKAMMNDNADIRDQNLPLSMCHNCRWMTNENGYIIAFCSELSHSLSVCPETNNGVCFFSFESYFSSV